MADEWAKRAADAAAAAGQLVSSMTVDTWLDATETHEGRHLRVVDLAKWRRVRDVAASRVQHHANIAAGWR